MATSASSRLLSSTIREREIKRASSKLPDLTKQERRQIDHMTRMIVRKILRMPMMKLNSSAGTPLEPFYVDAMRALFKLDTLGTDMGETIGEKEDRETKDNDRYAQQ